MNELAESLGRSPELFPYSLDLASDSVSFIRLSLADYVNASFLDARILTPQMKTQILPWPEVAAAIDAAGLGERCDYIFHIGHVGSTLLSRLLGAHPAAFALREPLLLRTFALLRSESGARPPAWRGAALEIRLTGCLKLLSRTFEARECVIVKATSFVSELAGDLLARAAAPKAVMMSVSPESYLATIMGGPNSRQEAKILAPGRLQRLHRRIGGVAWRLGSLSEGETVALGWACEMSALAHAARAAGARILCIDFDRFLADPSVLLMQTLQHFRIDATPGEVRAIIEGPHLHRYSKAPEHAYDALLRREVLNEARADHGAEIRRGLEWLERAAAQYAPVRDALSFAGGAAG